MQQAAHFGGQAFGFLRPVCPQAVFALAAGVQVFFFVQHVDQGEDFADFAFAETDFFKDVAQVAAGGAVGEVLEVFDQKGYQFRHVRSLFSVFHSNVRPSEKRVFRFSDGLLRVQPTRW